jgi:hypothetical protein
VSAEPCGSQSTRRVRPFRESAAARNIALVLFAVPPLRFTTAALTFSSSHFPILSQS